MFLTYGSYLHRNLEFIPYVPWFFPFKSCNVDKLVLKDSVLTVIPEYCRNTLLKHLGKSILPAGRAYSDYQDCTTYHFSSYSIEYSSLEETYINTSIEHFYHRIPFETESDMLKNSSVVSANYGASLLLDFQKNSLENNIPLSSLDNIFLLKQDYHVLLEKFKNFQGMWSICHNFGLNSIVHEFILKDKCMTVLSYRPESEQYEISRSIHLPEFDNIFFEGLNKKLPKEAQVSWVTSIRDECPNITTLPVKAPGSYNPLAYPTLGMDIEEFIKGYVESSSNILLMYSPPGMGKTSLLKHILDLTSESCLITYSEEIKNMDSLFAYFLTSDDKFLIIEDADNYLTARDKDANNHSMKKLLNITDGLTSNPDKKVIFTTNLPNLSKVDTALLRPGRCYKAIQFPYLSYDQAEAFLRSERNGELPEIFAEKGFNRSATFSLASLHSYLNGYDPEQIVQSNNTTSFGFGND